MKKLLSVITIIALTVSISFAQKDIKKAASDSKVVNKELQKNAPKTNVTKKDLQLPATDAKGAKMDFELVEVDYGEIEQNSDPYRYFGFSNTGTEPLVIQHAKGSCGCTVPKYPKEPILPGESAQIEVRYDTKRMGPFTKRVTLTTNAVNNSENKPKGTFELKIKGKVNPKAPEPEGVPASGNGFGSNN
ncbi:MAG: DUF1573 domain-containing protein [Bacteroidetes bacterium]|jgi:hypothetical protein|nr:DUF1573 domain-containing protein [Bacteroidota bacterium]